VVGKKNKGTEGPIPRTQETSPELLLGKNERRGAKKKRRRSSKRKKAVRKRPITDGELASARQSTRVVGKNLSRGKRNTCQKGHTVAKGRKVSTRREGVGGGGEGGGGGGWGVVGGGGGGWGGGLWGGGVVCGGVGCLMGFGRVGACGGRVCGGSLRWWGGAGHPVGLVKACRGGKLFFYLPRKGGTPAALL